MGHVTKVAWSLLALAAMVSLLGPAGSAQTSFSLDVDAVPLDPVDGVRFDLDAQRSCYANGTATFFGYVGGLGFPPIAPGTWGACAGGVQHAVPATAPRILGHARAGSYTATFHAHDGPATTSSVDVDFSIPFHAELDPSTTGSALAVAGGIATTSIVVSATANDATTIRVTIPTLPAGWTLSSSPTQFATYAGPALASVENRPLTAGPGPSALDSVKELDMGMPSVVSDNCFYYARGA